jgi:hypothetical protein
MSSTVPRRKDPLDGVLVVPRFADVYRASRKKQNERFRIQANLYEGDSIARVHTQLFSRAPVGPAMGQKRRGRFNVQPD